MKLVKRFLECGGPLRETNDNLRMQIVNEENGSPRATPLSRRKRRRGLSVFAALQMIFIAFSTAANTGVIEERYERLLIGTSSDYSNPVLAATQSIINAEVAEALAAAEKILAKPSAGQYAIKGMPKEAQNELRSIFDILPMLATGHRNGADTLESALALFDLLNEKGFKSGFELGIDIAEAHAAMESLGFFGFGGTLYNQLDGYPAAIFLLRDELKESGRWDREMETLRWCNELFLPGTENGVPGDQFAGYNSDGFRKLTRLYFPYALMSGDERQLSHFRKMLAKGLEVAPGFADTFKPDGTGYHHKGIYVGAYSPSTFIDAAVFKWLLDGTKYAYTETEIETVVNAYRAMRIMSETYDTIQGTGGRFPANASPLMEMLPGYAMLDTPETDAMFSRLWKSESLVNNESFLKRMPKRGSGTVELLVEKGAAGIEAEDSPEGFWTFPYGGMAVHRRDGWMTCVKGQSRYIWNYESSKTQNLFGYHGSSGALTILRGSRADSGYAQAGWDWERIPGTTAPDLGMNKENSNERQLTASSFTGGVALDGLHGVFATHQQFIPGKKAFKSSGGKYPVGEGWLEARKSYFFFDDEIVALGSGITATKDAGEVTTTLFQTAVDKKPKSLGNDKVFSDGVGNFYVVPENGKLKSRFGKQDSKTDRNKPSSGTHAVAWIEHGATPDNDGYEYAVLVQSSADKATAYIGQPSYRVKRKDNRAHIVVHSKDNLVGYALFESGAIGDELIASVDAPCLVMVKKEGESLKLSVCNPDFARSDSPFSMSEAKELPLLYARSAPRPTRITLNGEWKPRGNTVKVIQSGPATTMLEFACIDAQSVQVELEKVK